MKIQVLSDLHLEHGERFSFGKAEGADVLVLAGDIDSFTCHVELIRSISQELPTVMILGNHEPIGHSIKKTVEAWKAINIPNFYFLDNDTVEINGIHFIGSTLWTNLDADRVHHIAIQNTISDFSMIFSDDKTGYVTIQDLQAEFDKSYSFIKEELAKPYDKKVLITHHLPTFASVSQEHLNSPFNAAFASELSNMLLYTENLALCIHGHTHVCHDYMLGDVLRVVCNPRGYPHQNNGFDPLKSVEI